jgi:hypothetical protein
MLTPCCLEIGLVLVSERRSVLALHAREAPLHLRELLVGRRTAGAQAVVRPYCAHHCAASCRPALERRAPVSILDPQHLDTEEGVLCAELSLMDFELPSSGSALHLVRIFSSHTHTAAGFAAGRIRTARGGVGLNLLPRALSARHAFGRVCV